MDEGTIALVEDYLDGKLEVFGEKYEEIPFAHTSKIGRTVDYVSGRNRYIGYLISLATRSFFQGCESRTGLCERKFMEPGKVCI